MHNDGINTSLIRNCLGLLRERLVSMGHEPSEDELIAVANSDMGKRILSLFQQQLGVNNELEKDAVAARDAGEEDSELASNIGFIRSILKEKGMNASEEEIKKLASTERSKEPSKSNEITVKTDQVSALLQIPIVKTFRQQLESQGMKLSDEHFEELLKTTQGRGALRDFIDQTTKAQRIIFKRRTNERNGEDREGREVLRKYAKN